MTAPTAAVLTYYACDLHFGVYDTLTGVPDFANLITDVIYYLIVSTATSLWRTHFAWRVETWRRGVSVVLKGVGGRVAGTWVVLPRWTARTTKGDGS